ncbi:hypothetical protein Maq22A_1p38465 (plasmid) [Methylobacterium aquaticum]|uniref:Uncharacterized protein n=1 Tax=Methylobacterium aquaticum TaxID=270351 RepID=A0A1Y0ZCF0_9HYPH|nr:hypothetical protein Maq22A_1p38465 [Methylobacterium aquaticum]
MTCTSARVPFGVAPPTGVATGTPGRGTHASQGTTGSPPAVARRARVARFERRALARAKRLLKRH